MIDLKPTYATISRKLEQVLQNQAPYKTGRLRASVQVTFDETGFVINLGSATYGIFLHEGTERERDGGATSDFATAYTNMAQKNWNPNPGEGTDGIKPRYWMNFSDSIYEMINEEISAAYAEAINEILIEELGS